MNLKELNIKPEYRSFNDDIVKDFYIPVLSKSIEYKRAVGFFSSTALIEISKGISQIVEKGGKIKLITSPYLSEEDLKAMKIGYEERERIITARLIESLDYHETLIENERLNLLANLIATETLDIKVVLVNINGNYGMYHEKMGIMMDKFNNKVVFSGSMNESFTAMRSNYETIDVFCSWKGDGDRISIKENIFDKMWIGKEPNISTVEIPEVKKEFIKKYNIGAPNFNMDLKESISPYNIESKCWIRKPDYINELHGYQREAIDNWSKNNYRGIFDMATGTGKTITALAGLSRLANQLDSNIGIFVVCPYKHLIEQWVEDIEACGVEPLICYSSYNWKNKFEIITRNYSMGIEKNFFIITTNATFSTEYFQSYIDKINGDICLVVDEAHNFGSKMQIRTMKEVFKYRLALSATLERHNDSYGTKKLYNFFGEKCIEYGLKEAINDNNLSRYYYYPVPIILDHDEYEEYEYLSTKIARIIGSMDSELEIPESAEALLIKRSRIIAGARNKIPALSKIIRDKYIDDNNILVYCGSANVEYSTYVEGVATVDEKRQIEVVIDELGNNLGMSVRKFTSEETSKEREQIKKDFSDGEMLQALIAIRCLDEGVNIPGIKTAFLLASSTNPKEYIQRRGRVLRKSKNKKFAEIYDFITLPREIDSTIDMYNVSNSEISLIKREFMRMDEFSSLSENSSDSDILKGAIKKAYNLDIIEEGVF